MLQIYYFNQTPFPRMDDSFQRSQNLEKLKELLQKIPGFQDQEIALYYYRLSSGRTDNQAVCFFELFSRIRLRKPYILVFNTLADLSTSPANALKILRRWKDRIDPNLRAYFTDYGFSDYGNIEDQLYDHYGVDKVRTRVNLAEVFPYTLGAVEEMRSDKSPTATIGHSKKDLEKYHCDYNRFISIKAVADYINEEVRSLNLILKPSEGTEYSPRGIKIGQIKQLSGEQKKLLKTAMEKDYQAVCKRIDLKVIRKKYHILFENEQLNLEEISGN